MLCTSSVNLPHHTSTDEASETGSVSPQQNVPPQLRPASNGTQIPTLPVGDANLVRTVRNQNVIGVPKPTRRRHKKKTSEILDENDEPVEDQTAALQLHSKKTERLQRKQQKRSEKLAYRQSLTTTLFSLPSELLSEIFAHLLPTDIASLLLTNRSLHSLVSGLESTLARDIIRRRYWVLQRCFTLPVPFASVPRDLQPALLSSKRQEMLNIHRRHYLHIQNVDPQEVCTCLTCVFAWNNLCLIIDLHHWQPHLENREPLPIIPRGSNPQWNKDLLHRNANLVRAAMIRPIVYARILQMHLDTITRTIQRTTRWRRKAPITPVSPVISARPPTATLPAPAVSTSPSLISTAKPLLYNLTTEDAASGTDVFLDRKGPPSYDFPYMRDNYYSHEAYLPNRRWNKESERWMYNLTPLAQHLKDLEYVRSWAEKFGIIDSITISDVVDEATRSFERRYGLREGRP